MASRTFSVGGVIGDSMAIFMNNLVPFFILAAILIAPGVLVQYWILTADNPSPMLTVVGSIVSMVLTFVLAGALVYGVYQQMRKEPVPMAACIATGFARLLPVLGTALVTGILIGIGMILFILPGLILMTMWWVVVPVAVVERKGVVDAISRSGTLTAGSRISILGIILIIAILNVLVAVAANRLVLPASTAWFVVNLSIGAFFGGWTATATAVGYHDLRASKEGIRIENIAGVFE